MNCHRFYTLEETAALLACSTKHVQRMVAQGKLATVDIGLGRKKLRVSYEEMERLAKSQTAPKNLPKVQPYTPKHL